MGRPQVLPDPGVAAPPAVPGPGDVESGLEDFDFEAWEPGLEDEEDRYPVDFNGADPRDLEWGELLARSSALAVVPKC